MTKKELVNFLKQAQKMRIPLKTINRELIKAGWGRLDIDEAIKDIKTLKVPAMPLKTPAFTSKKKEGE